MADNLILDVELLRGKGDPENPTQIVNKNFAIWAKLSLALQRNSIWFLIWERPPLTGSMKEAISGIMMEEVAFRQTSTSKVIKLTPWRS